VAVLERHRLLLDPHHGTAVGVGGEFDDEVPLRGHLADGAAAGGTPVAGEHVGAVSVGS
jgi:hypothetical protein